MTSLLRTALAPSIARTAVRIALVVGTLLNVINQGAQWLRGDDVSWVGAALNYFVPYCVASISAAKHELAGRAREPRPESGESDS
ncbi:MAG: nitrate/nitrite transporter NrtS [Dehalococcoidia bacterium]